MSKKSKSKAAKASKPKPETFEKHISRMESVAKKHGGVLPSATWLAKNGYKGSYTFLMWWAPEVIGKMKRKFERGGSEAKSKAKVTKKPKAVAKKKSAPRKLDTSVAQPQPIDEFSAA